MLEDFKHCSVLKDSKLACGNLNMYTRNYLVVVLLRHRCALDLHKIETVFKFKTVTQKIYAKESMIKNQRNLGISASEYGTRNMSEFTNMTTTW